MNEIDIKEAKCTKLSMSAPVQLSIDNEDGKAGLFAIDAYTGVPVERWWGKLSIDLNGIKASGNMPIFLNHDPSQIVGWADKAGLDGSFKVSGKFSNSTKAAKEVAALADEGFPWQASIGVAPVKILSIEQGGSHDVNGQTITGPAEIWTESEVFETSFVPLGADSNTSVATFSKFDEKLKPEQPEGIKHNEDLKIMLTIEDLKKDAPGLLESIQDEAKAAGLEKGATAERTRIQTVLEQSIPGHEDIVQELAFDGKTTGPEAAVKVLAAEKKLRSTVVDNLASDAPLPVGATAPASASETHATPEETFKADAELQKEFGDVDTYLAYIQATGNGLVKSLKNKSE